MLKKKGSLDLTGFMITKINSIAIEILRRQSFVDMSVKKVCVFLIIILFENVEFLQGQTSCRFADLFTIDDLVYNRNDAIHRFKMHMCLWEGQFGYGVGYNHEIGITFDGHEIDYTTGDLYACIVYDG